MNSAFRVPKHSQPLLSDYRSLNENKFRRFNFPEDCSAEAQFEVKDERPALVQFSFGGEGQWAEDTEFYSAE